MSDKTISAIEPWALSLATSLIATAHGRPYADALHDIALELMVTRARGKLEGIAEARKIIARRAA